MDKTTRQMINEKIEDLNNIVKQLGLGDTYRTQHLTEKWNKSHAYRKQYPKNTAPKQKLNATFQSKLTERNEGNDRKVN